MAYMRVDFIDNRDCIEGLMDLPDQSVDLILSDPPYGINYSSSRIKDKSRRLGGILNDKKPFIEFIGPALRVMKPSGAMFIFTRWDVQQTFIDEVKRCGGRVKNVLIWDKGAHGMGDLRASYGTRYESIIFIAGPEFKFPGKRPVDILAEPKVPASRLVHPNEKPVRLIEKLIMDTTIPGAKVCDPFMGSGTTAEACVNTQRHFLGYELDEKYYKLAVNRVAPTPIQGEEDDSWML
jgi:site-specific DNA-methyltransferase (adenine-specific)